MRKPLRYNVSDLYWILAGDPTRVWSSARASYVPSDDETYQAQGGVATRIGSETELAEVLGNLWPHHVPRTVLTWKARAALKMAGKFEAAAQAVAASNSVGMQEVFEYSAEWHRDSPAVNAMAQAIGLTSDDVDELFRTADSITV